VSTGSSLFRGEVAGT